MKQLVGAALWVSFWAACSLFASPPAGYYLVWSDEFNGLSLDAGKWSYRLPGTYRDAYNTPNAVSFNGSNLVITTYTAGGTNFSCMLYSHGKFESKYGYWESSIKWGDSNGVWSSFWMLSPSFSYSAASLSDLSEPQVAGSELDTCEHRYVDSSNTNLIDNFIEVNLHWYDGSATEINSPGSGNVGSGLASGFHTYGFLWTSNAYSFLVDGAQVYNGGGAPISQCTEYALLSSAVDDTSTTWAGYIPAAGYGSQNASTTKLTVDYVRYYAPSNDLFWTGASSEYWNNSANWLSNMAPLSNSDLTFSYLSGSALSMTPEQDYTIDGLVILTTSASVAIGGGNILTLGRGGIDMEAANHPATISAPLNLVSNQTWAVGLNSSSSGPNTMTVSGSLSGASALTKSCYGTLILSGSNSFSGSFYVDTGSSTANDGIVCLASSGALAEAASPLSIRNTAGGSSTLQLESLSAIVLPQLISLAGRSTNIAAIENVTGSNMLAGGLEMNTGGSQYLIQCDDGTLNLGGTISAGSTATEARTLTLLGAGNFYVSGSTGNGSASPLNLIKTNAGSLTFASTNTYTGSTTIAGGALLVNGVLAGGVAIGGTSSLGGCGSIGGATVIQSGATLAPGSPTNTISFGSTLTLNPGSVTILELDGLKPANSRLSVSATLAVAGTLIVTNVSGPLSPGENFTLFSAADYSGSFSSIILPPLDPGLAWNTNGLSHGILSIAATVAPQFTSILQQNGALVLTGAGAASQTYELETAANITPPIAWTYVASAIAQTNGVFQFSIAPPAGSGAQFYRVAVPE